MSVDQTQVIDVVSKDPKGTIVLSISDHLDWDNTKQHLLILQEKINTYLNFVDSGEICEKYPDAIPRGCCNRRAGVTWSGLLITCEG